MNSVATPSNFQIQTIYKKKTQQLHLNCISFINWYEDV